MHPVNIKLFYRFTNFIALTYRVGPRIKLFHAVKQKGLSTGVAAVGVYAIVIDAVVRAVVALVDIVATVPVTFFDAQIWLWVEYSHCNALDAGNVDCIAFVAAAIVAAVSVNALRRRTAGSILRTFINVSTVANSLTVFVTISTLFLARITAREVNAI